MLQIFFQFIKIQDLKDLSFLAYIFILFLTFVLFFRFLLVLLAGGLALKWNIKLYINLMIHIFDDYIL